MDLAFQYKRLCNLNLYRARQNYLYRKHLFDGKTYTDSREVVTSQATGHNWKVSGWTWSDDNTQATVTVTCQNNTSEVRTLNAEIHSDVVDEPTCVDEGKTMYTAMAKDPETEKSYVTFKNVTTPVNPDGHAFEAAVLAGLKRIRLIPKRGNILATRSITS